MSDTLMPFSLENRAVRGQLVRLDESFKAIIEQHHYPEALREHLGETLVVAVLLMGQLKMEGQITVQFDSREGPIKMLVAKCNHRLEIRALAQFDPGLTQDNLHKAFSNGRLVVTLEFDNQAKPYQSIIALNGGSVARAMEGYFMQSEQLPTRIILASKEDAVAGFLLQQIPEGAAEEDWEHALIFANTLKAEELLSLPYEDLLKRLYHEDPVRVYPERPVSFKCPCSEERMQMAVKAMGPDEAFDVLAENQAIVVTCEYCNNEYAFGRGEVEAIFKAAH